MRFFVRLALISILTGAISCSRYDPETGGEGDSFGGDSCEGEACGGQIECEDDDDCTCHETCSEAGRCEALGAPTADFAANAHGNWVWDPDEARYDYQYTCATNDECPIGQICNLLTGGCIVGAGLTSCADNQKCEGETVCDDSTATCVPPALCYVTRNCCEREGFSCDGRSGDTPGLCLRPQCDPPASPTSTCPLLPREISGCPGSTFCNLDGRCVECTCDDDCPDGPTGLPRKCEPATSTCVDAETCETAADCESGQTCNTMSNRCTDRCDSDIECGGGRFCDTLDDVCRCVDDIHESNNSSDFATVIEPPDYGGVVAVSGALCRESFDEDWYSLELLTGDRITVDVGTLSTPNGDVRAIASDGSTELAEVDLVNGFVLDFNADDAGTYFIQIVGLSSGDYNLAVWREEGVPCDQGGINDSPNAATLIAIDSLPAGCVASAPTPTEDVVNCTDSMTICDRDIGDTDAYVFDVAPGALLTAVLSNYPDGNLDIELYGPFAVGEDLGSTFSGLPLVAASAGSGATETVAVFTRPGGRYLLAVTGHGFNDHSSYDLELTFAGDICIDDAYDQTTATPPAFDPSGFNDEPATASGVDVALTGDTIVPLAVCPSDIDWFRIGYDVAGTLEPMPALHRMTITVTNANPGPLNQLLLYAGDDPNALAIAATVQSTKTQEVFIETAGGDYYAVVVPDDNYDDLFTDYELQFSVEPPPSCDLDDLGDADPMDRNDMPAAAYVLDNPPWPGAIADPAYTYPEDASGLLSLCAFDHDWYRIDMPADSSVIVDLDYDHTVAEAGLAVYDFNVTSIVDFTPGVPPSVGLLKLDATSGTGHQSVRGEPSVGPAFILVYNRSAWPLTTYSLTVDLADVGCPEDIYEPNDSAVSAVPILVSPSATLPGVEDVYFSDLTICGNSDDWFELDLGPDDRIRVNILYTPAEGNLDLMLYGPSSSVTTIASDNDSAGDGLLEIDYDLPPDILPGTYRIKVDSTGGGVHENVYDLEVLVNRSCVDDRYSPATFSSPYPFDLGSEEMADGNMQLCDTEDWLEITYPAGGDVSLCIRFVHVDIDLDLELYTVLDDPATTPAWRSSLSKNDWEEIIFTAAPGTSYWTRVFPDFRSVGTTQYSMWVRHDANGCESICADAVVNGDESDVDCGGSCAACAVGFACGDNGDCVTGNCNSGTCE